MTHAPDEDSDDESAVPAAPAAYSSPACYAHEFASTLQSWDEIRAWRKQTREARWLT